MELTLHNGVNSVMVASDSRIHFTELRLFWFCFDFTLGAVIATPERGAGGSGPLVLSLSFAPAQPSSQTLHIVCMKYFRNFK